MTRRGRDALLEVLDSEGVTHLFGNPGTTELPLIDALAGRPDLHYVLGLQEATVVAMADGYAQATGRPAFVNLHTAAGLGNAIGNLTNARANGTPLVVTAGQQDRRHLMADPLLSGDLVGMARPVVKWAHEVRHPGELGTILRRAFADAATPPSGPVFVSIPSDVLDEEGDAPVPAPSVVDRRVAPPPDALDDLAALLAGTPPDKLALVAGDEASGATDALLAVAEALGARVHLSPLTGSLVVPQTHPLFAGSLPPAASAIAAILGAYERVFLVGAQPFLAYPYTPGPALPHHVELLHLSPDPSQLGRTYPVRLGLVGDPRATLEALLPRLPHRGVPGDLRAERTAALATLDATARERYDASPMHPMAAVHALLGALPPETPVIDEAVTASTYVRGFHHATTPGRYYFARAGGLGWGMPAALGVSLGLGREPVLCAVGDGSALYSPQALWTAAAENLPVVFAVLDNRQYLILKRGLRDRHDAAAESGHAVGMDIDRPPVDFVALAAGMGVSGVRVEAAADVGDAVRAALDAGGPHLIELPVRASL
jgi:benzoylformate decarboxylase